MKNKKQLPGQCTQTSTHCVLEASLHGYLPGHSEKQVFKRMIAEGDPTNKLFKKTK